MAIDKCLATTLNMKVQTLGNMYEMLCESFMMYGVELWGFDTEWKETKKIYMDDSVRKY